MCNADEARRKCSQELSSGTPTSLFGRAQQLSPRVILSVPAGPCPQLSDCCRSAFSQMGEKYLKSSEARGTFPWVVLHVFFFEKVLGYVGDLSEPTGAEEGLSFLRSGQSRQSHSRCVHERGMYHV